MTVPPDTRKQSSAMPPNYVHSLDSTHMMLTALHCQRFRINLACIIILVYMSAWRGDEIHYSLILCRAGITFEAVHDSFWTHACFVDIMNKVELLVSAEYYRRSGNFHVAFFT